MSDFKFDEWCVKSKLKGTTKDWLVNNGCNELEALQGLDVDKSVPFGVKDGVDNLGEHSKLRRGIEALKLPSGSIFYQIDTQKAQKSSFGLISMFVYLSIYLSLSITIYRKYIRKHTESTQKAL